MEYIDNDGCNIKNYDAYIRIVIAVIFTAIAIFTQQYYFLIAIAVILLFTGVKRHCYIYDLFAKDGKFSMKNYYMSHLPKYDPSSVFMFDKNGKVYFQNTSAKNEFVYIKNFCDFKLDIQTISLIDRKNYLYYYSHKNTHYQLNVQNIKEINSILVYASDITQIVNLNDEIEKTQKEIIYTMGEIGETRSKETGNHVKRVAQYSHILALLYGLDEDKSKILKLASPMHDIGKIAISDHILNKPAKLTDEEFEVMKTHSKLGFDMLKNSDRPIIKAAAIVAQQHHEKYDGTGYPNGLKGEGIHIYGRITAITDVFDALGSDRCYKKAWDLDKIISLFQEEKGKHFDPQLIDLFVNNLDKFIAIRDKYKDG